MQIEADDIHLFAVDTGELYAEHQALARYTAACPDRATRDGAWTRHVENRVMPMHRRAFGRSDPSPRDVQSAAAMLKAYYEAHVREMDDHAATPKSATPKSAKDPSTGLVFEESRRTLSVEIPVRSMLSLLEHESASHDADGDLDHTLPSMASRTLGARLDEVDGVSDTTYDGHFGPYVFLTVDSDLDTETTRSGIARTIKEHLDEALEYVRLPHVVREMARRRSVLGRMAPEEEHEASPAPGM